MQQRLQAPTAGRFVSANDGTAPAGYGPLPTRASDHALIAIASRISRLFVDDLQGVENIAAALDPFILVANHTSRREALALPPLLFAARGGRRIHFVADWNFQLIPGVGWLYRRAGVITATRKPAKPKILNALKPWFTEPGTVLDRARHHLDHGRPVAIFPEGTVNRRTDRLLSGRRGAAQLSLETGVPIVPAGISMAPGGLMVRIGVPLYPSNADLPPSANDRVRAWHAVVMGHVERLSGKTWNPHRGEQR